MKLNTIFVDLDGTLIKTDLLPEMMLNCIKCNFLRLFLLPYWVLRGKAYLKMKLDKHSNIDVSVLPYNEFVLQKIKRERSLGREIVLATGSPLGVANRVSSFLGLFDSVLATREGINLTGEQKLLFIKERCGNEKFDYIGNDSADIPILTHADKGYLSYPTKSLSKGLIRERIQCETLCDKKKHGLRARLKPFRLHQWSKNALIFAPLLLSHAQFNTELLIDLVLIFTLFGTLASATYLINDLFDLDSDRRHQTKKNRLYASGDASVLFALPLSAFLLGASLILVWGLLPSTLTYCLAYLVLTLSYSFYFKRFVILDVIVLAALYTVRIFIGGALFDVDLSFWLLSFSMFVFFSLALVKRCTELKESLDRGVEGLKGRNYLLEDFYVLLSMGVCSAFLSVLVIALFLNSPEIIQGYTSPDYLWVVCPILLYWLARIWIKVVRGEMDDDPVAYSLRDRTSLFAFFCLSVTFYLAV